LDDETKHRLEIARAALRRAEAELDMARAQLRSELDRAIEHGTKKAEIARLFGITRQAVQDLFRGDRKT